MKVLMVNRASTLHSFGGDTVQMHETGKALTKMGVQIVYSTMPTDRELKNCDLIHLFNISTVAEHKAWVHTEKPMVISTIDVDYSEFDQIRFQNSFLKYLLPYQIKYLKVWFKHLKKCSLPPMAYVLNGQRKTEKQFFAKAKYILPNSLSEYERLMARFKMKKPYRVIPNGVNESFLNQLPMPKQNMVLCVGRIEGNKNQLSLIKAIKNTPYPLVIVGNPAPNHQAYYEACLAEANEQVTFIPHLKQAELIPLMQKAKVHALPSFFETTGLVNLEAGALNCNIVACDKGDVRSYLGDEAFYCNPLEIQSIQHAIELAMTSSSQTKLRDKIEQNFTWMKAAELTLETYQSVLRHEQ